MAKLGQIGPNHQILLTPGNKGGGYCRVCVLIKCSGYIAQKLPVLVSDTTNIRAKSELGEVCRVKSAWTDHPAGFYLNTNNPPST